MAKKLVSFNFNGDFVPELEALSMSYPLSEVSTTYCTTAPSRMKEYSTDTYLAEGIDNYLGSIDTMHLFVGLSPTQSIYNFSPGTLSTGIDISSP